jgi:hypothetical protein
MNWTEFVKFLASGYLLYYGILILLDLLKPERDALLTANEDLVEFPEEAQTTLIEEEDAPPSNLTFEDQREPEDEEWPLYRENVNVSTGGIGSMVDLFRLAHDETVEVKKKLVY